MKFKELLELIETPANPLSRSTLFLIYRLKLVGVFVTLIPFCENLKITQSSTYKDAAPLEVTLTPLMPVRVPTAPLAPAPLIESPRRVTVRNGSLALTAMLIITPVVPLARIEPKVPVPSSVIDLVTVTAPKPPGSRQSISPLMNVLEIAPAKVLQGAVRLQGLTSSPTPETQVLVAWALASEHSAKVKQRTTNIRTNLLIVGAPYRSQVKL
jgi:hypothetical protein